MTLQSRIATVTTVLLGAATAMLLATAVLAEPQMTEPGVERTVTAPLPSS